MGGPTIATRSSSKGRGIDRSRSGNRACTGNRYAWNRISKRIHCANLNVESSGRWINADNHQIRRNLQRGQIDDDIDTG